MMESNNSTLFENPRLRSLLQCLDDQGDLDERLYYQFLDTRPDNLLQCFSAGELIPLQYLQYLQRQQEEDEARLELLARNSRCILDDLQHKKKNKEKNADDLPVTQPEDKTRPAKRTKTVHPADDLEGLVIDLTAPHHDESSAEKEQRPATERTKAVHPVDVLEGLEIDLRDDESVVSALSR
jgi:DNA-directed RNA polymerase subunit N (RpoN/RPB10)